MVKGKATLIMVIIAFMFIFFSCSGPVVREYAKPSIEQDQFLRIKRIAVFPFDNFTDGKDAEKAVESLLLPALYDEKIFDDVVDPRFVRDTMKKLKITSTDILDREQVKKLADELGIQGVIVGKVVSFGKGKDKEAANEATVEMSLVDGESGRLLWTGNVTASGGLTVGKVFGVTPGESNLIVARKAVTSLISRMADSINDAREREKKGIVAGLREKELIERRRLQDLKKQTRELDEKISGADEEAEKIREEAREEVERIKADMEMEKAAIDAEKSQLESEKEQVEREREVIETERRKLEELQAEISNLSEQKIGLEEQIEKLEDKIQEEPVEDKQQKVEETEQGAVEEQQQNVEETEQEAAEEQQQKVEEVEPKSQ